MKSQEERTENHLRVEKLNCEQAQAKQQVRQQGQGAPDRDAQHDLRKESGRDPQGGQERH